LNLANGARDRAGLFPSDPWRERRNVHLHGVKELLVRSGVNRPTGILHCAALRKDCGATAHLVSHRRGGLRHGSHAGPGSLLRLTLGGHSPNAVFKCLCHG
jgi:hypothetical protein